MKTDQRIQIFIREADHLCLLVGPMELVGVQACRRLDSSGQTWVEPLRGVP